MLQGLPEQMFCNLLKQKLEAQGVSLSSGEVEALSKDILRGGESTFVLGREGGSETNRNITLEFSSQEIEQIEQKIAHFFEHELHELIESTTGDISRKLLADLKQRWAEESQLQREDVTGFRERVVNVGRCR